MGTCAWPLAPVLAHRCGGALAPENTLAGLAAAAAAGCRGVEFDVMLSGDGSPVLIHDETLERTTDGRGRVADISDERLRALDAGCGFDGRFRGERVPLLSAAAERCRTLGLSVNLEIKPSSGLGHATGDVVARAARALWTGSASPPVLSSFSVDALIAAGAAAPDLPRGLLVGAIPPDWRARCSRIGAVALHVDARDLVQEHVVAVRAAGLCIVAYTVDDPARAAELFAWGTDCVITDRPDLVRAPGA